MEAFRYLLKPVRKEKLWESLDRFLEKKEKKGTSWLLETAEGLRRFPAEELLYLESFSHYCQLHTEKENVLVKRSISALEEEAARLRLPLFRCHRSYLVCLPRIKSVERERVVLTDTTVIPVSRRLYRELGREFIRYFRKER